MASPVLETCVLGGVMLRRLLALFGCLAACVGTGGLAVAQLNANPDFTWPQALADLPAWSKAAMYEWLRWYHVTPRADLFDIAAGTASALGGESGERRLHRGFSWIAVVRRP